MDKKINFSKQDVVARAKEYREPVLSWGKDVVISFYSFNPEKGSLQRKRIKLNRELGKIKSKRAQKEYAEGVLQRIREELENGYNPWISQSDSLVYTRWEDACEQYKRYLEKQMAQHNMREESVTSYMSYQRVLKRWVSEYRKNVHYAYQFDKRLVDAFLDYIYLDKNNSIQTRNNYLAWIKTFSKWLVQKSMVESDPTAGIPNLKKKDKSKNRDVIPDDVLRNISLYLEKNNKHYLLACYLLHYLFVRPHELALLKIEDFNLHEKTLYIHWDVAKNWTDAVVTLPMHVINLMIDLEIFKSPGNYYLFSDGFKPGIKFRSEKCFRDYWTRNIRKELGFSDRYKFYSLKDTGITNMLRANTDVLSVRDQARHSSILITDIYTPKDIKKANKLLLNYKGIL